MVNWLIERSSVFAGVLVGGGWSVLVSMGIHWAVNPIMINNIAQNGFDYICPFTFACNFAVIGGAVGGAFLGIMKVVTTAFTFGSVTTFPAFVSSDPMNFAWAMVGMLISAVVAGVLAFAFTGKEDQLA